MVRPLGAEPVIHRSRLVEHEHDVAGDPLLNYAHAARGVGFQRYNLVALTVGFQAFRQYEITFATRGTSSIAAYQPTCAEHVDRTARGRIRHLTGFGLISLGAVVLPFTFIPASVLVPALGDASPFFLRGLLF